MQPKFEHDCTHCNFLGHKDGADLYFHKGERAFSTTVIARQSSEPSDYSSGMCFAFGSSELLTEARIRAQAQGLLEYPYYEALSALRTPRSPEIRAEFERASIGRPERALLDAAMKGELTSELFETALQSYMTAHEIGTIGDSDTVKLKDYLGWFLSTMFSYSQMAVPTLELRGLVEDQMFREDIAFATKHKLYPVVAQEQD